MKPAAVLYTGLIFAVLLHVCQEAALCCRSVRQARPWAVVLFAAGFSNLQ
jgi:hypothetical protein